MEHQPGLEDEVNRSVARCLEILLERRHWTSERLAEAIGVSVQTLRNWRSGSVREPRLFAVARLHELAGRVLQLGAGEGRTTTVEDDLASEYAHLRPLIEHEVRRVILEAGIDISAASRGNWQSNQQLMQQSLDSLRSKIDLLENSLKSDLNLSRRA